MRNRSRASKNCREKEPDCVRLSGLRSDLSVDVSVSILQLLLLSLWPALWLVWLLIPATQSHRWKIEAAW